MATGIPTIHSSQSPSTLPSISICISTPIPTFDLSLDTPFPITVILKLHYHQPITFRRREEHFFVTPLGDPGLVFTNIRTGEKQIGSRVFVHYMSTNEDGLPTERNKEGWLTLHPGQPHTLDATIEPISGEGRMRTIAEMESGSNERFATLKWPLVHALLDGEVYEISVSKEARIKKWMVGDLGEILDLRRSNLMPIIKDEVIDFELKETSRFEVKRPDRDGSLNWP
ncbi:uncharacterized protein K460DRAFT_363729 [Cucurbitaria berberidis CBS 394.84]|uniref:Uncharacterized protein n=1 Tax=Cucurbitaria berberidis CBS 394.84 TaxID=1168544 RepID=A0A9P4GJZ0_9PLEO|nr:uncharacterized protein K460DRAFT_363729 [Cucurbitaria berberidis CBS 394.84]KAF1847678.1 hypothetical protein K460DRAFT_363729 [Cucurbitaria berberidis CBS 394.84]